MKILMAILLFVCGGCTTIIEVDQFRECLTVCQESGGMSKAGRNPLTEAKCCECKDGSIHELTPDIEISYKQYPNHDDNY